jgi:subtilisin family serine protease
MGNEGSSSGSLWSPADAPGALAVGAVDMEREITSWSSRGPTSDGRIKPDLCAMGSLNYRAIPDSFYSYGSGTSFAAPLIAGASALVLQAHPDWLPDQVEIALKTSADHFINPDNDYGWGVPDVMAAIVSRDSIYEITPGELIHIDSVKIYLRNSLLEVYLTLPPITTGYEIVNFRMINILGKSILLEKRYLFHDRNTIYLNMPYMASGMYFLVAEGTVSGEAVYKVVIIR